MATNQAAWITAPGGSPLQVSAAVDYMPAAEEIVIRSQAVAMNPVDWKQQELGLFISSYPSIFGCDVAGIVEKVGSSVSRFKKGDRVISNAVCLVKGQEYGAFQLYMKSPANVSCLLPSSMTFEEGCVLPLAVNTAAIGLFSKDNLGLPLPSFTPSASKAVFIYGGSTSVGSCAIQLAKAAGAVVATTASKRNHQHCRDLGADIVFDYADDDWIDQAEKAMKGMDTVGVYDTVTHGNTSEMCYKLLKKLNGKGSLMTTNPPVKGVTSTVVFGENVTFDNELAQGVWADFLEPALAQGRFSPQPKPQVVGQGLEKIQEGMDLQRKGVSAVKLVVLLK